MRLHPSCAPLLVAMPPSPLRAAPALGLSPGQLVGPLEEAGAAALLLGTALGGGFLALPHATAPAGCLPSAAILVACWLFLFTEAVLVSDLVIDFYELSNRTAEAAASFDTLGRQAFGPIGGNLISGTFLILMMTTLVAQIAKGSALAAAIPASPAARCALIGGLLAVFARAARPRVLGVVNGLLTCGFVASAACLFQSSTKIASWSRLARADWSLCWQAAPTLLQLHVYAEIVPTICELLSHSRSRVRRALLAGSTALLAMQLSWSTLGIAVSDFGVGGAVGGGLRVDPVDALLASGGLLSAATTATAGCAIATTVLGTTRALSSWCADALAPKAGAAPRETPATRTPAASQGRSRLRPLVAYGACIAVPTIIAARTRAAEAFFGAIDLAGAYPVALLWGLAPPLMTLRMRSRQRSALSNGRDSPPNFQPAKDANGASPSSRRLPPALLVTMAGLSIAFMGTNLATDLAALLSPARRARWQ